MSSRSFAQGTKVPASKSRDEIEHLVRKRGATQFLNYSDETSFSMMFAIDGIRYRFTVPLPDAASAVKAAYDRAGRGERRNYTEPEALERETARLWRALLAVVKARIISVEEGIDSSFEHAFLANIVTDNDQTIAERHLPTIKQSAIEGRPVGPLALPGRSG